MLQSDEYAFLSANNWKYLQNMKSNHFFWKYQGLYFQFSNYLNSNSWTLYTKQILLDSIKC